eukprot:3422010-Rhodomonas_salina.1
MHSPTKSARSCMVAAAYNSRFERGVSSKGCAVRPDIIDSIFDSPSRGLGDFLSSYCVPPKTDGDATSPSVFWEASCAAPFLNSSMDGPADQSNQHAK